MGKAKLSYLIVFGLFFVLISGGIPQALAVLTPVTHVDGLFCDTLVVPPEVDELGIAPPFPAGEVIATNDLGSTIAVPCPSTDDPDIPNLVVDINNLSRFPFTEVWYVANSETSITNRDGAVIGPGGPGPAFLIDTAGINTPLVFESMTADGIFEPGETWRFIIQDYFNTVGLPPSAINSIGVTSGSPPSSGSIIAVQGAPPPLPTISIDFVSRAEGDAGLTAYTFTVTRSDNTDAISVDFATADGTATIADNDYQAAGPTTLTFTAGGGLTRGITVQVVGDTNVEPVETFFVNLSNCAGCLITDNQGLGLIQNDDVAPPVPVGGTMIPIDTTALLLAGAQMNAAWLIPVIVAIVGIGIVIARKL